jgi:hypothetical protein
LVAASPGVAAADHGDRPAERLQALGHSPHPATFLGEPDGVRHVNSDLAFWGDLAFNGNYDGFRVIDISSPREPREIVHQRCNGDQGDVFVWDDVLVRSWNSKKPEARLCDGQVVPAGFEGVHVFDVSDPVRPGAGRCGRAAVRVAHPDRRAGRRPVDRLQQQLEQHRLHRWGPGRRLHRRPPGPTRRPGRRQPAAP